MSYTITFKRSDEESTFTEVEGSDTKDALNVAIKLLSDKVNMPIGNIRVMVIMGLIEFEIKETE